MKNLFLLLFALTICIPSSAQEEQKDSKKVSGSSQSFNVNSLNLMPALGFGYNRGYSTFGLPAVVLILEKGLKEIEDAGTLGLGASIGYVSDRWDNPGYTYKYNTFMIGGRVVFYQDLIEVPDFDIYAALNLGFFFDSYKVKYDNDIFKGNDYSDTDLDLYYGFILGAKYFLNEKFTVLGEVGYDISYFKLGLSFSLK